MGKTNILMENQELIDVCKKIRREHRDAIDILLSYTDKAEETLSYCIDWLHANVEGLHVHKKTKLSLEFYTDAVEAYFKKYGEGILTNNGRLKLRYGILCNDGPMTIGVCLEKDRDAEWSAAQLKLHDALLKGRSMGGLYCSKNMGTLLPNESRFGKFDEALQSEIDKELNKFVAELKEQMKLLD